MSKKKFVIIGVVAVAAAGVLGFLKQRTKPLEVDYKEVAVKRSTLEVKILSTGVVQPENRLDIKPPIAGRIERVMVNEGDVVKKGQILAWMSSTERAALLDAARAKGPAEVKHWEELYKPSPIMAPISGTIIQRNVESGQTFATTDAVLVMSDRLTIKAQVDETDIAQIKLKQKADVILDAYPNQTIPAVVDQIAYDAKTVNNVTTYEVDVLPDKTPDFVRSGMTANVTFFIANKENVLLVPNEALKVRDDKFIVLEKAADQKKPVEKQIDIGLTDGKSTEILGGLEEGEVVLVAQLKGPKEKASSPFMNFGSRKK